MRLKKITAPSTPQAMARVKKELGEGAVILDTQESPESVSVTAAADSPHVPEKIQLQALKTLNAFCQCLDFHRVPSPIVDRLMAKLSTVPEEFLIAGLQAALEGAFSCASPKPEDRFQPIALVGPPGIGKSLAIGKLAAAHVLEDRSVQMVTTDRLKAGAIEQSTRFSEALGVNLKIIETPLILKQLVATRAKDQAWLIDTPGVNPFDPQDMERLKGWMAALDLAPTLVLPAGIDAYEALDMAASFHAVGVKKLIVTRIDLSHRLGGLLAVLGRYNFELSYLGSGPEIARFLEPGTAESLERTLLEKHHLKNPSDTSFEDTPEARRKVLKQAPRVPVNFWSQYQDQLKNGQEAKK